MAAGAAAAPPVSLPIGVGAMGTGIGFEVRVSLPGPGVPADFLIISGVRRVVLLVGFGVRERCALCC